MATFSSFADLKDLRQSLRQKEAEQAQAKADAIIVDDEQAKTNPLKQKAARLAAFTNQALEQEKEREQRNAAADAAGNPARGHNAASQEKQAPPRGRERSGRDREHMRNQHSQGNRGPRMAQNAEQSPKERRAQQERAGERLDRALQRLQRHSNSTSEAKKGSPSERQGQQTQPKPKQQPKQAQRASRATAKGQKQRQGSSRPVLVGKFFDVEALKAVRAVQDEVRYQDRRLLYRALEELDQLISKQVESLMREAQKPAGTNEAKTSATTAPAPAATPADAANAPEAAATAAAATAEPATKAPSAQEFLPLALEAVEVVAKREQLKQQAADAAAAYKLRCENLPKLEYPEQLPVSQRKDEIVKAISEHQVVIIAGETGSGKTTQIPKMCLEAGLGRKGLIGHTQPRRIAARAVAARIAEEMHEELGHSVAYKVRFTDISSDQAYIKLMTDGILLSELSGDRLLLNYDVIIIDEAHERSLNIDFLLGYLKGLLSKRPELKLIITSATIDVERFAQHFNNAPIIEVSGRTYPVEVVYMPLMEDGKGVYVEGHDGKGHYETLKGKRISDPIEHESAKERAADPELNEGPGAWRDYQQGPAGSLSSLRAASTPHAPAAVSAAKSSKKAVADDDRDLADVMDLRQGILQAFEYLQERGRGDTLVFLPGERDILEIAQFLRKAHLRDTEIIPLYARLATAEQNKIFTSHTGVRIVLATNVAETSLTVPGIRYVIDPGLARISRYSARTKVQRLPIEPISQASANQRKGRCGRVSNGICVRLYSKEDFANRPEFTDPEILRTNLASVLLQMASLRLGRIENFPFIDAPAPRQISDGLRLLHELGATTERAENISVGGEAVSQSRDRADRAEHGDNLQLTPIGRMLSRLPCDPRLGRMIIEADKYHSLSEVLVIVSLLAVMDPREYPLDKKEAATQSHARFNDEKSDFCSILKLYDYIKELQSTLSNSAMRRRLKQEFLSFLRVREWLDVHRQLRVSAQTMGLKCNEEPSDYESIHRALISGLLSQLGMLEPNGNNYVGARGTKFVIFPASPLSKKPPKWVCAAELSETSRLFARTVAAISPDYAEATAGHLLKNSYAEPHWSKKSGAVMAYLTRTLYGLPIVQKRVVQYQSIDPKLSHELMIRDGFVAGNMECKHRFFINNLSMIDDVEYLEDKVRRRDLLVDSSTLEQFYHERIPEHICNLRDFDKWWRQKSKEDPNYLDFSYELIAKSDIMAIEDRAYPEFWQQGSLRFKLSYVFDPGNERDGVTVHIPITVLNQVKADDFLWQISGLRNELYASLIRSLPKRLRRNLIPAPEYAKALSEALAPYTNGLGSADSASVNTGATAGAATGATTGSAQKAGAKGAKGPRGGDNLFSAVAYELTRMGGEIIEVEDFDRSQIEPYLFMNFSIEGVDGSEIAFGKDFIALSSRLQNKAREVLHQVVKTHRVTAPAQNWEYGTIKKEQVTKQGSLRITAYPALTDRGDGVTLELYDSPERQAKAMRQGSIKLLALSLKSPASYLETHLPNRAKLSMYYQPLGSIKELINDLMLCAINNIMERHGGIPWDEQSFTKLREVVRGELNDEALNIAKIAEQSLVKAHELKRLLKGQISFELARSYADISAQLDRLVYKGFISECGMEHLQELPRYLQAAIERISRVQRDVVRDQMYTRTLEQLQEDYEKALRSYHQDLLPPPLLEVKWMIEELRVSYFAQHLGVKGPISDKRIYTELDRITKEYPPQK